MATSRGASPPLPSHWPTAMPRSVAGLTTPPVAAADRRAVTGGGRRGEGEREVGADRHVGLVVLRAVPGGVEGDPERAGRAGQADEQAGRDRLRPAGRLERGQGDHEPAGAAGQPVGDAQTRVAPGAAPAPRRR